MPDIPGVPEQLVTAPGVQMNAPPAQYIDQPLGVIGAAVAKLGPGEKGKLVWVATLRGKQVSVNVAVVNKFNEHFEVVAYVGKDWGKPLEAGIVGHVRW